MKYFLLFTLIFATTISFAKQIPLTEAETTAKNVYFEKSGINQSQIIFEDIYTQTSKNQSVYYIFNVKGDNGFVIISADDLYTPVIAYSLEGRYINENQPENVAYWMSIYTQQIQYLRDNNIQASSEIIQEWAKYNVKAIEFTPNEIIRSADPLVGDILWDQGSGWNQFCPEDDEGPGGHVYVGCVATAMSIIMKYWEYPIAGTGSTSYYAYPYGTLSVNFADANYFWNQMPNNTYSPASAYLSYHAGVAVHMGYAADGSGAYSQDVPESLANHFGYSNAEYKSKSNYTSTGWVNLLKDQIDLGYPIYYSGRDVDNGGHAFVCSGYDDSDNFHFNFGWSGSNNGFYSLSDVGSFHISQAAVINFYPSEITDYSNPPIDLVAELDNTNYDNFTVEMSWEAPSTAKSLTGYKLYRGFDEIAEVGSDITSYIDNEGDVDNYEYSVRAIYSDGVSLCTSDYVKGKFNVTLRVLDPADEAAIHIADVIFNGETAQTGFGNASFYNVPMGGGYYYEISKSGYPTTSGNIDVNADETFVVYMNGEISSTEELGSEFQLFPNPSNGMFNFSIPQSAVNNASLSIVNISGKVIYSERHITKTNMSLDISSKPAGVYILVLNMNDKNYTKTIVIK